MDKDLAEQVVEVAARVVASGAISANGHGKVSIRVPGSDEMSFTAGPSLRNHPLSATAYAVAQRPIGCWVEALAMSGLPTGVPFAGYGPRGSEGGDDQQCEEVVHNAREHPRQDPDGPIGAALTPNPRSLTLP